MKRICFLDLEGTVVDTWNNGNIYYKIDLIKKFIEAEGFDEVRMFSFAIYHEGDVTYFNENFRPVLEKQLGVKIHDDVLTTDFLKNQSVMKWKGLCFDKTKTFVNYVEKFHKDDHCTLVDDMVRNEIIGNIRLVDVELL